MSNKRPIGMFRAVAKENDGTQHEQTRTDLTFSISENALMAGGFDFVDHEGQKIYWGVMINIQDTIKPGTFKFTPRGETSGFYNPPRPHSSWVPDGTNPEGEITLTEVDHSKKFAHGTFSFEVFNRHNSNESAKITGAFSLTAGAED